MEFKLLGPMRETKGARYAIITGEAKQSSYSERSWEVTGECGLAQANQFPEFAHVYHVKSLTLTARPNPRPVGITQRLLHFCLYVHYSLDTIIRMRDIVITGNQPVERGKRQ
jgi:hypothetical protein